MIQILDDVGLQTIVNYLVEKLAYLLDLSQGWNNPVIILQFFHSFVNPSFLLIVSILSTTIIQDLNKQRLVVMKITANCTAVFQV